MNTIPPIRRYRLMMAVAASLLLSGCVTISDPIEEPAAIPPAPTMETAIVVLAEPTAKPARVNGPNFLGPSDPKRETPSPTPSPTPQAVIAIHTVGQWENLRWIAEKYAVSVEAIMAANNMTDPDVIVVGQQLVIPSADQIVQAMVATGTPVSVPRNESGQILHFVQAGETLSSIAAQYDISRDDLLYANGLRLDALLIAGDTLIIPQGEYVAIPTATPQGPTPVPTMAVAFEPSSTPAALEGSPTAAPSPTPATYTVQAGDLASEIARDNGVTVPLLAAANPGVNMDRLSIGMTLVIPAASNSEAATATPLTLEPSPTPTEVPPVIVTHIASGSEGLKQIGEKYGVTEEAMVAANPSVTSEPITDTVVLVPIGTPTFTPSPTSAPTMTPTPAPEFQTPLLLLPANETSIIYREGMQPIHLLWTSTGILGEDEFYVARLRAVSTTGSLLWVETRWTQTPGWRLEDELLNRVQGTVTLRWDVMVMRRTSEAGVQPATGEALSEKSPAYEIRFTGPLPAPEASRTSTPPVQATGTPTRTPTATRTAVSTR